jgi:hypothetical protein
VSRLVEPKATRACERSRLEWDRDHVSMRSVQITAIVAQPRASAPVEQNPSPEAPRKILVSGGSRSR